jgi:hypothetical protein
VLRTGSAISHPAPVDDPVPSILPPPAWLANCSRMLVQLPPPMIASRAAWAPASR